MPSTERDTVVLADDHNIVREGIASLCATNGMKILGEAADGPEAIQMILELRPAFAIIDLQMPTMTGVQVVRKLRDSGCQSKLLILSFNREETTVVQALFAGADAYLLKDGPGRHLMDAINFVRDGGVYVSPLLRGAGLFTHGENKRKDDPLAALSPREVEVFSYLMDGMRAKDIAELLAISPKTVDTYRASLMRKLDVHGMVGLVKFALERNLASHSASR
jgi:DNA-binding NarL/FixJ family response regulator